MISLSKGFLNPLCVCVCEREREREKESKYINGMLQVYINSSHGEKTTLK